MSKMIQMRNVPDEMHKRLKIRAAERGKTLSGFLVEMAERELARPDVAEFLAQVRRIPRDTSGFDATAYIRRERDSR